MRILHVITSLRTGGAEKLMIDLLPKLRNMGNEVELLLFDGTHTAFFEELEKSGIKIHSLSIGGNVYNPINIFKLFVFLKKNKFDIVHTHNTACQLFAAFVSVLCSVVFITTEHNTSNRRRAWKWYGRIDRWMYGRYTKIICISDAAEKNLCDFIGKKMNNVITVYNGIDTSRYADATPLPESNLKTIVTMVAGFRYQKDQDTLIKAIKYLSADKYELWLVGDGERRQILENLAERLNIGDRVRFWGIRSDVPNILKSSDIIVMSSHFEGLSLSNLEGMSVGKPFIGSNVDGLREITKDAGLLFEHGNAKELAQKIELLAMDKQLYKETAEKCKKRSMQFDISVMADKYNKLYQQSFKSENKQ